MSEETWTKTEHEATALECINHGVIDAAKATRMLSEIEQLQARLDPVDGLEAKLIERTAEIARARDAADKYAKEAERLASQLQRLTVDYQAERERAETAERERDALRVSRPGLNEAQIDALARAMPDVVDYERATPEQRRDTVLEVLAIHGPRPCVVNASRPGVPASRSERALTREEAQNRLREIAPCANEVDIAGMLDAPQDALNEAASDENIPPDCREQANAAIAVLRAYMLGLAEEPPTQPPHRERCKPIAGPWVNGVMTYDERGLMLASASKTTEGVVVCVNRPHLSAEVFRTATEYEAMTAIRERLATWCDVTALTIPEAP